MNYTDVLIRPVGKVVLLGYVRVCEVLVNMCESETMPTAHRAVEEAMVFVRDKCLCV